MGPLEKKSYLPIPDVTSEASARRLDRELVGAFQMGGTNTASFGLQMPHLALFM